MGPQPTAAAGPLRGGGGRPWARVFFALLAVALVVVIATAVYAYQARPGGPLNPYIVTVPQVVWTLNGAPLSSGPGFSIHAGKSIEVSTNAWCAPSQGFFGGTYARTCQSGSVYLLTTGFGVQSTNAPTSWSSGYGGANVVIRVTVVVPSQPFSGNLAIDLH